MHDETQAALREIAQYLTNPEQRRAFAEFVSAAPDIISVGRMGHRRTLSEVVVDLWGVDAALDIADCDAMSSWVSGDELAKFVILAEREGFEVEARFTGGGECARFTGSGRVFISENVYIGSHVVAVDGLTPDAKATLYTPMITAARRKPPTRE